MTYARSGGSDTIRKRNPITLLIRIYLLSTDHSSREGTSIEILPSNVVAKIVTVPLIMGMQIIHLPSTTIDVYPGYLRGSIKTLDNASNPPMDMYGIFHKFIFVIIWFVSRGWIGITTSLLFWIISYLFKYLLVVYKHNSPKDTV